MTSAWVSDPDKEIKASIEDTLSDLGAVIDDLERGLSTPGALHTVEELDTLKEILVKLENI
jgi:molecular chaperone GrpE (heat shock protein)